MRLMCGTWGSSAVTTDGSGNMRPSYVLVSKDTDFYQRSLLHGAPPKVVWVRIGNAPMRAIAGLLRGRYLLIRRFYEDREATFLTLPPA
jgi:predicted nuclease of predicted toxin-antitoxin system